MTVLSNTFKRGKCSRTDLIAYENSEHDKLSFILVPLRGNRTKFIMPDVCNRV